MKLQVGLGFTGEGLTIHEVIALGQQAEDAGLDSVWHGENQREPWVPLSVIAAHTKKIRVGTGVTLWTRSPATLELAAANLDELSHGRFVLGIGTGPQQQNEMWHGLPYKAPVNRMREYIELLRLLWTAYGSNVVDYSGMYLQVRQYRRAMRPYRERIPIYIGAVRHRMVQLAGELADGLLLDVLTTSEYAERQALPALMTGITRAHRSRNEVAVGALLITAISTDAAQAREWARGQVASYLLGSYVDPVVEFHGLQRYVTAIRAAAISRDRAAAIRAVGDELLDTLALAGSPDQCRERLTTYSALDFVVLVPPTVGLLSEEIMANVHTILETVCVS